MHQIYDITKSTPLPTQDRSFALDTHILLWAFYSRCAITRAYQKTVYPEFIQSLISNENRLVVTTLNINEMLHFIEKNECDIYNNLHGKNLSVKRFRQLSEQRIMVQTEAQLILKQLSNIPCVSIESLTVENSTIESFIREFTNHNCDFFDYYLLDYCNRNNLAIITDDADYVNDFVNTDIYTANPQILQNC
jgi:hypothetical protein